MLTIIGCGNANRGDDAAGVVVAQRLRRKVGAMDLPGVRVFDAGTGGMDVMFQARGSRSLIVVDASASGSRPGSIFEVPGDEIESAPRPGQGLHAFRWDNALYAGRLIFKEQFPRDVTVYLIEGERFTLGAELSAPVEAAVDRVVELIVDRLGEPMAVADPAETEVC